MIEEQVRVIESSKDYVWVESLGNSACGTCSVKAGCGQQLLKHFGMNKALRIKMNKIHSLTHDDQIIIGINERALIKTSILVYGLPLIMFILMVFGTHTFLEFSEPLVIIAGLFGLIIGFILSSFYTKIFDTKYHLEPVFLRAL